MLNVALFGPPGAGKGTQSEYLIKEYKLFYISTGDILRKEIQAQTKLGIEAQSIIASGGLVSDEIIVQIIENTITENRDSNGFLFDGFPRTLVQAYILEGLMIKLNKSLNCLISLEVDEEISVERLLHRGKTSGRSDDNETVIRNRLREYKEKTLPVLEFYKDKGICYEMDGLKSIEEVHKSIRALLNSELEKSRINFVLFGYPGSGRGSQGKALAQRYGLEYVSTGEMLEEEIQQKTAIGIKIKELYENGENVPDEIVIQLIEAKISSCKDIKGFIFKGYPRTLVQSYILDGLLKKHGTAISLVMDIEVPTLELINRLDMRSKTDRCMPYDTETSKIVKRLFIHEKKTLPVIEKYNQLHGVAKIDGMGSFDEVYNRLCDVIEKRFPSLRQ